MDEFEIVSTKNLGVKSWVAEATREGEIITGSGKTEKVALIRLAERLANPERARKLEGYRWELAKLHEMAENPDCSDSELLKQRQRLAEAHRKLKG